MSPTKLLYLEDFTLLESEARVLDVLEENGRAVVVLDQTVFYPQGGGQPYDQGIIESDGGRFLVEEVRFVNGVAKHIGKFESGNFQVGATVKLLVNTGRRALMSRLHSAGHVIDMAVNALGLEWTPGKGYHFPNGPYVEYSGNFERMDKEKLRGEVEEAANKFVGEGRTTKLVFMPKEEMYKVCHYVPDYIPAGKPARVVMYGEFGIPCGGTHVSNLSEIRHITIRKIKAEKGNIRIAYDIEH